MLKRSITYEDFNGDSVTEIFYFNITKTELVTLDASHQGETEKYFLDLIASEDAEKIVREFTKFLLMSYGIKSEDGKRFEKSEELRTQFHSSAAFDALFIDLVTNVKSAEEFIAGVIPKDLAAKVKASQVQDKPSGPPLPPSKV